MKKTEIFPLILAIIGLCADLISIGMFVFSSSAGNNINYLFQKSFFVTLCFFLVLYLWLISSRFMIRRNYKSSVSRRIFQRRLPVIRNAIVSFGVLLLPVTIIISNISGNYWLILFHVLCFPIFYVILFMLLPLVYEEMRVFITRIGDYVCRSKIYVNNGEILIQEGERISVIKSYGIEGPYKYYFQKGNVGGYLLNTDLINNFKISKSNQRNNE